MGSSITLPQARATGTSAHPDAVLLHHLVTDTGVLREYRVEGSILLVHVSDAQPLVHAREHLDVSGLVQIRLLLGLLHLAEDLTGHHVPDRGRRQRGSGHRER